MVPSTKSVLTSIPYLERKNNAMLFQSIMAHDNVGKPGETRFMISGNVTSLALAPTALVGAGTAVFCSSALSSSSHMTPLSVFYMLLLALQYSLQPRISKKYLHPKINKSSVALVEEGVKFSMASSMLLLQQNKDVLKHWNLSSSVMLAGVPAVLYALQGVLYIFAYQNLDSVTMNGIAQTKMLWAATCCYLLLQQKQSPIQIVALVLVGFSAMMFQNSGFRRDNNKATDSQRRFTHGLVPCMGASFLSGLAGALSQKGLQLHGSGGRNAYLYTMEVSGFTALTLIASMLFRRQGGSGSSIGEKPTPRSSTSFFAHWQWSTCWPILLKAMGGVLTALVHKYAGSVAKGFALICGLVLSGVIQTMLDQEPLSPNQIVGMLLVNLSSWLHFTNPKIRFFSK